MLPIPLSPLVFVFVLPVCGCFGNCIAHIFCTAGMLCIMLCMIQPQKRTHRHRQTCVSCVYRCAFSLISFPSLSLCLSASLNPSYKYWHMKIAFQIPSSFREQLANFNCCCNCFLKRKEWQVKIVASYQLTVAVCVLRYFANFHYDVNEIENIFIKKFQLLAICIAAICLAQIKIEVVAIGKY